MKTVMHNTGGCSHGLHNVVYRVLCVLSALPVLVTVLLCLALPACGGGSNDAAQVPPSTASEDAAQREATAQAARAVIEQDIRDVLDAHDSSTPFTLALESFSGAGFVHSVPGSSLQTRYDSASTAKWVTAAVILQQVDAGMLSLADHPQDYLSFWPTEGPLADITLQQLLAFTSGLVEAPECISNPLITLRDCVEQLAVLNANDEFTSPAGSVFFYGPMHMQVAGLMTIEALALESWDQVFDLFRNTTNLFAGASYDFPSLRNPRLAGGMNWTGQEYLGFLRALVQGDVLSQASREAMFTDQLVDATIGFSASQASLGEDWHYGMGVWLECAQPVYNCSEAERYSSAGAFGGYPFIDFQQQVFGILARQGEVGTFVEGKATFDAVRDLVQQWAATF